MMKLHAPLRRANYAFLHQWKQCEGGTARDNPLNTTEPMPGATDYNSAGVKNYVSGTQGIDATYLTLINGHYNGIVHDLRTRSFTAKQIAERNVEEIEVWGTNPTCIINGL